MMLHQDGSRHVWIEGLPPMDLIVTMDLDRPCARRVTVVRVGTEKLASSRTKKLTKKKNNKEDALASTMT